MNITKRALCAVFAVVSLLSQQGLAQDYANEMKKLIKSPFHKDFQRYQFFSVPMTAFGVGTMYPKAVAGDKIDIKTEGLFGDPRTWWINSSDTQANEKEYEAIFASADSPVIDLKGKKTKSISLSAALPALLKLLTASGSFDWNKTTTVTLTADTATNHLINWSELDDAVNGDPNQTPPKPKMIKDSVVHHIHAHDFAITVGDVVLTDFKAHVAVTGSVKADAKAQLDKTVSEFAKDSKASFEYKSNGDGSFDLTAKKPVVVAVYIGVPPPGSVRAAGKKEINPLSTPNLIKQLQEDETAGVPIPEN